MKRTAALGQRGLLLAFAAAGVLAGVSVAWMAALETRMSPIRIIDLEFAWTANKLERLLAQWGNPPSLDSVAAATRSFQVDFLFIAAYVLLLIVALRSAIRTRSPKDAWVRAAPRFLILPVLAGGMDALENCVLIGILQNALPPTWASIASGAAAVKFSLIAVVLLYCMVLWLSWSTARDLARFLRPIWVPLGTLGVVAVGLVLVPQGQDVVRAAGESLSSEVRQYGGTLAPGEAIGLMVATTLWAFMTWYWIRTLLSFHFPGDESLAGKPWVTRVDRWLPSLAGASAFALIGIACLRAAELERTPREDWQMVLALMGAGCLFMGAIFGWATERYIPLTEAARGRVYASIRRRKGHEAKGLPLHTQLILFGSLTLGLCVFLAFTIMPVKTGQLLGAAATLLMAVCVWMQAGTVFVYCALRYQFPMFRLLLGTVAVFSVCNDNHGIRLLEGTPPRLPTVEERLRDWHARLHEGQPSGAPGEESHALYVVAAEGGGIRAAYWTAAVLGRLEDTSQGQFSRHLFAISGVSGGSLGAAVFASQLAAGLPAYRDHVQHARSVLGKDFLAPTLGAMLFPDMVQHFLPFPLRVDRAWALESSWEYAWLGSSAANPLREDFYKLWEGERRQRVPSLLLNATLAESGRRVVASDLSLQQGFPDVFHMADWSQTRMSLSTAVHLSARFPYISPGATFPNGFHVVDGGYFENSGCATAEDLLIEVSRAAKALAQETHHTIVPKLILITNGAAGEPAPTRVFNELLLPVQTILSTREGRGRYAQTAILRDGDPRDGILECARFGIADPDKAEKSGVRLPLGWMLSRLAQEYMESQAKRITYQQLERGQVSACSLPSAR